MTRKKTIKDFILTNFMLDMAPDELDDSTSLFDTGIIDSVGILELVEFIQDEFQITVEDSELVQENFDSIDFICNYLEKKGIGSLRTNHEVPAGM